MWKAKLAKVLNSSLNYPLSVQELVKPNINQNLIFALMLVFGMFLYLPTAHAVDLVLKIKYQDHQNQQSVRVISTQQKDQAVQFIRVQDGQSALIESNQTQPQLKAIASTHLHERKAPNVDWIKQRASVAASLAKHQKTYTQLNYLRLEQERIQQQIDSVNSKINQLDTNKAADVGLINVYTTELSELNDLNTEVTNRLNILELPNANNIPTVNIDTLNQAIARDKAELEKLDLVQQNIQTQDTVELKQSQRVFDTITLVNGTYVTPTLQKDKVKLEILKVTSRTNRQGNVETQRSQSTLNVPLKTWTQISGTSLEVNTSTNTISTAKRQQQRNLFVWVEVAN